MQPPADRSGPVSGTIAELSADRLADATVNAISPGRGSVAETQTDQQGRFEIDGVDSPVWLRATAPNYITRTTRSRQERPVGSNSHHVTGRWHSVSGAT